VVGVVSMIVRLLDRIGFLLRDRETRPGRLTNAVLYALNTVFIALYVVSTYDLPAPYPTAVRVAELGLGVVFLGEYVARVYSADDPRGEVTDPFTVVDLVAVLPVFALGGANVGFLRGFHTLRVFRFLRLLVDERQVLGRTLHQRTVRRVELSVTIFLIFFITSGFVYAVEVRANPGIENFGEAFYYTVIAVSTVGFGDIVPVTVAGRWVTVAAVLVGFVLIPWQASRLRDLSTDPDAPDADCPRCGQAVARSDRYCRQCGDTLSDDRDATDGETL
jgi:voltage-gated potassium channel